MQLAGNIANLTDLYNVGERPRKLQPPVHYSRYNTFDAGLQPLAPFEKDLKSLVLNHQLNTFHFISLNSFIAAIICQMKPLHCINVYTISLLHNAQIIFIMERLTIDASLLNIADHIRIHTIYNFMMDLFKNVIFFLLRKCINLFYIVFSKISE